MFACYNKQAGAKYFGLFTQYNTKEGSYAKNIYKVYRHYFDGRHTPDPFHQFFI